MKRKEAKRLGDHNPLRNHLDEYGMVQYEAGNIVRVHLIHDCKGKAKAASWIAAATRPLNRVEYRLLYLGVINRLRSYKGVKPAPSILPQAGSGLLTYKPVPKGTTIGLSCYGCNRIRPANGFDTHTFFLDKVPMSIFPYQACHGAFINDGTIIFYNGKYWRIPEKVQLTNAKLELPPRSTNMPRVVLTENLPPAYEIFVKYEKGTTFADKKLPTLWGPANVFGEWSPGTPPVIPPQIRDLYAFYYRDEDEEESEEELGINEPVVEKKKETEAPPAPAQPPSTIIIISSSDDESSTSEDDEFEDAIASRSPPSKAKKRQVSSKPGQESTRQMQRRRVTPMKESRYHLLTTGIPTSNEDPSLQAFDFTPGKSESA